jgi:hypothetical protein
MSLQRHGIVHGTRIELDADTGLPPGSAVTVDLYPASATLEQRRRLIDMLCGAWDGDDSLGPIFEVIQRERALTRPRDLDLDAAP